LGVTVAVRDVAPAIYMRSALGPAMKLGFALRCSLLSWFEFGPTGFFESVGGW
jgi:hypothetical protein